MTQPADEITHLAEDHIRYAGAFTSLTMYSPRQTEAGARQMKKPENVYLTVLIAVTDT
jgi:hypothetical protein